MKIERPLSVKKKKLVNQSVLLFINSSNWFIRVLEAQSGTHLRDIYVEAFDTDEFNPIYRNICANSRFIVMARSVDISHSTLNVYSLSSIKTSAGPVNLLVTTIKVPYLIRATLADETQIVCLRRLNSKLRLGVRKPKRQIA